jgi:hypothetical protein
VTSPSNVLSPTGGTDLAPVAARLATSRWTDPRGPDSPWTGTPRNGEIDSGCDDLYLGICLMVHVREEALLSRSGERRLFRLYLSLEDLHEPSQHLLGGHHLPHIVIRDPRSAV